MEETQKEFYTNLSEELIDYTNDPLGAITQKRKMEPRGSTASLHS